MKDQITPIPLANLALSDLNVRKDLDAGQEDGTIENLAAAIQSQGLLSPLIVRSTTNGNYEVIAGQRRLRACRSIELDPVPCIVRDDLSDSDCSVLSLIENVQRADMSAVDKARALKALYDQRRTYDSVAIDTGLSITTVKRYVLLLDLPDRLQKKITTAEGARQIVAMSQLAETFQGDAANQVYDQIVGLPGRAQVEIIKRSDGDLTKIETLVEQAKAGIFDIQKCGGPFGCRVIGEILNGKLSQEDFEELAASVAENLEEETRRQAVLIAARGFWKTLVTGPS